MKNLLFVVIALSIGLTGFAQQNTRVKTPPKNDKKVEKRQRSNSIMKMEEEEGEVTFKTHSVFGIKIATDGYGLLYEKGKMISPRKVNILQFELNEKMSTKEEKTTTGFDFFGNVSSAKYGKANNFYQLKVGYGQLITLGGKANKNGVSVSVLYAGGLSLGLLKPYYVDVEKENTRERLRVKFSDTLPQGSNYLIKGASGFTVGWAEVKVAPGLHAKTALRFDYGRFNESVAAVEAGVNAEYYTPAVLQMAIGTQYRVERNFFFNAYIAIEFGKRKF
ncbi:MAG: hypothetical protein ABI151_09190 [Chitinophagaceae bacterium]